MAASPLAPRLDRRPAPWMRFSIPSWLVSLVVHATLLVALMLTVQHARAAYPAGWDAAKHSRCSTAPAPAR